MLCSMLHLFATLGFPFACLSYAIIKENALDTASSHNGSVPLFAEASKIYCSFTDC